MFGFRRTTDARGASAAPPPAQDPPSKRTDPDALLRRLEWTVMRRLDGLLQGDYRSLFRGFGLDLADLREYQSHDDVRYIDWNVTARMQTPYVREFQEDREVTAWFLLDLSGSVDFGSGGVSKRALSSQFVAILARLLTRYGNRVGAIFFSDSVDFAVPARGGRRQVLHILSRMLRPSGERTMPQTDLSKLLERAQRTLQRRSVVFVVSDFISTPGWHRGLSLLARRHETVAVRLSDPLEHALPDLGLVVMQDAETGEQMFVDTRDRRFRERYTQASAERETTIRAAFTESGVDCLELSTDDDLVEALIRFSDLRKRRSRLAGGTLPAHLRD
jgi:uncharacterized protein (DUF58 family)